MRGQNGANTPTFIIFISSPNLIVFSLDSLCHFLQAFEKSLKIPKGLSDSIRFGLALVMSEIEGDKGSRKKYKHKKWYNFFFTFYSAFCAFFFSIELVWIKFCLEYVNSIFYHFRDMRASRFSLIIWQYVKWIY